MNHKYLNYTCRWVNNCTNVLWRLGIPYTYVKLLDWTFLHNLFVKVDVKTDHSLPVTTTNAVTNFSPLIEKSNAIRSAGMYGTASSKTVVRCATVFLLPLSYFHNYCFASWRCLIHKKMKKYVFFFH